MGGPRLLVFTSLCGCVGVRTHMHFYFLYNLLNLK